MCISKLKKAQDYEKKNEAIGNMQEHPLFHVTPAIGWMNDPNGFSFYKGEYHLFYQYHPYSTEWGPMHWGHVKSKDMISWKRLPIALAPDEEYDMKGCFSGSALELPNGKHAIMYTGVSDAKKYQKAASDNAVMQMQCMAYGDGVTYEKYAGNPVITYHDIPSGGSVEDFRDPKFWYDETDSCYYAIVGNRAKDGCGSLLLFSSADTFSWHFVSVPHSCKNQIGKMWECPDFFSLCGKNIIITSPQEVDARDLEFHNGNNSLCMIGKLNAQKDTFVEESAQQIDYGLDFYAPQTLLAPDGRRIMIGWMQSWERSHCKPVDVKWFGMMTIPRELSILDGRLIQNPIKELEQYEKNTVIYEKVLLSEKMELKNVCGRTIDMTLEIVPLYNQKQQSVSIYLASNEKYYSEIHYSSPDSILTFNRTHSGFQHDVLATRQVPVRFRNGAIKMRIIMDRYSIEIFVNDGEQAVSATIYTPQEANRIYFESKELSYLNVKKSDIIL